MLSKNNFALLPIASIAFLITVGMGHAAARPLAPRPQAMLEQVEPQLISLSFKAPKRGSFTTTAGGATRSFCVTGQTPLTVLVPSKLPALTAAARPTFFVYVPPTKAEAAEFVLKDKQNKELYRSRIAIAGKSGIVSFTLPEAAPALEMGQDYQWFFSMICRPSDRLEDVMVSAWVSRVEPDAKLVNALSQATASDRPQLYADEGYWYDALANLATLLQANPTSASLKQDWAELLSSVGLTQVANLPLVPQLTLTSRVGMTEQP